MADDLHYVPGDFYRIDDRSGFKTRAKKQRKEWTGLIVANELWEIRHPQDFVKGVIDDQTVPEPRSRVAVDPTLGPPTVTLLAIPTFVPPTFDLAQNGINYIYPPGSGTSSFQSIAF